MFDLGLIGRLAAGAPTAAARGPHGPGPAPADAPATAFGDALAALSALDAAMAGDVSTSPADPLAALGGEPDTDAAPVADADADATQDAGGVAAAAGAAALAAVAPLTLPAPASPPAHERAAEESAVRGEPADASAGSPLPAGTSPVDAALTGAIVAAPVSSPVPAVPAADAAAETGTATAAPGESTSALVPEGAIEEDKALRHPQRRDADGRTSASEPPAEHAVREARGNIRPHDAVPAEGTPRAEASSARAPRNAPVAIAADVTAVRTGVRTAADVGHAPARAARVLDRARTNVDDSRDGEDAAAAFGSTAAPTVPAARASRETGVPAPMAGTAPAAAAAPPQAPDATLAGPRDTHDLPSSFASMAHGSSAGPKLVPAPAVFATNVSSIVGLPVADALPARTADQIVQAMRIQLTRDGGEAHIKLDPQQFGEVSVRVRVEQGQVVARIEADAPVVREWVQSQQHVLRQSLAGQQLTLDRLEVSAPRESADTGRDRERDAQPRDGQPQQRQPRRRTPSSELFDVVA